MKVKLAQILYKPISGASLGLFRIITGFALTAFFFNRFSNTEYVDSTFVKTQILFKYPGLDFIEMGPPWLMYFLCFSLGFASLFLAIGFLYRFFSMYLLVTYSYLFFLDCTLGNNHFYLFILLFLFFSITNCHYSYSLDRKIWNLNGGVNAWNLNLFRFQFMVVYFMGGIAKLNGDWLSGKTTTAMTYARFEGISEFNAELFAFIFAYGGVIFDLTIPFLLLFKKGRYLAFPLIILFNITNLFMHKIDIFPLIMISSFVLFIPQLRVAHFMSKLKKLKTNVAEVSPYGSYKKKLVGTFLSVFVLFQILFPLRHHIYDGNILWTGDGFPFSWHMMTSFTGGSVTYKVTDQISNEVYVVAPEDHLNPRQHKFLFKYPDLSIQFAHLLKEQAIKDGIRDPEVNVLLQVRLNGRAPQYLINPNLDLTRVNVHTFKSNPWVLPLDEDV